MNNLFSRLIIILLLSALSFEMSGANQIKIETTLISKGQEAEIPVSCEGDGSYIGFQTSITLPEGLSFVTPYAYLSDSNSATHQISSNVEENTLKVASFSSSNAIYSDLSKLFYIKVKASQEFETGVIEISNTFFSTPDHEEIAFPNSSASISAVTAEVESVTLSASSLELKVGDVSLLVATVMPEEFANSIKWISSDPLVASVDDGYVTALGLGSATITATCGNVSATCEVSVIPTSVESITLSTKEWNGGVGDNIKLSATVSPDNATDKTINWSTSDESIATVDAEGNVTAIAVGSAVITATAADGSGVQAECQVTVVANVIEVTSISISTSEWTGKVGESVQLIATVLPVDATNKIVTWATSDSEIATVDSNGNVKAVKVGSATITVTTTGGNILSATCQVTVIPTSVESIILNTTSWSGKVGDSFSLTATVLPEDATDKTVTWVSSDESVATVDADGKVTAVSPGEATITATCGSVSSTCKVTVVIPLAESISLSLTSWSGKVGESVILTATVLPEDATDKTVTWASSDESVATVDSEGKVAAVSLGEAIITATCGSVSATCKVTVVTTLVESISLSLTSWSGKVGESVTLTATLLPDDATDKTVTWASSDDSVATVDAEGKVRAVSLGEATIKATSGNVSATCKVTVVATPIESIHLSASSWSGKVGETIKLTANVLPDDATDKTVTWTSGDASVATVDAEGKVTAVSLGETVITASAGNVSATCSVTVVTTPVESISIHPTEWNGEVGSKFQITATILPEDATDKRLGWSSSDASVAGVSEDGMVEILSKGECVITVSTLDGSNLTAECYITGFSGIEDLHFGTDANWDVYSLSGQLLMKDADKERLNRLEKGVYILHRGRTIVKAIIR